MRISNDNPLHREAHLSAQGGSVFASYGGSAQAGASVGTSYSSNAGSGWALSGPLPILPPFDRADFPSAVYVASDLDVHLITNSNSIQYFQSQGFPPVSWGSPAFAIGVFTNSLLGYELHSIASDPGLRYVYACTTENTDDAQWSSTVLFARSLDDGLTWEPPLRLSSPYCKGSSLAVGPDGTVYVAWVDYSLGQAMVCRSTDHGATFSAPVPAADMLDNLAALPLGLRRPLAPERTYPWYRTFEFAPNFPSLAVDQGAGRGNLYLVWAEHAEGVVSPATETRFETQANDTPETAQPLPLDCDLYGDVSSADFPTDPVDYYVFQATAGETVWLDGIGFNETIGCQVMMELPGGSLGRVGFVRFMYPPEVPQAGRPKALVFTAPRTGRYFLEPTTTFYGTGYQLMLRHYAPTAGSVARDMRDIVLVRSGDGGVTWSPKVRVNHDAAGHDQCMPNVAVDGRGAVYVAWYDRRDAPDGDSVCAYASVSRDGGVTFGSDLRLSRRASAWLGAPHALLPVVPGDLVGDRIALAAGDDYGVAAWVDFRDWPTRSDIYAARITDLPTAVEAVSDLAGEAGPEGARLTWLVNDASGVSGLRVYRAGEDGAEVALGDADLEPVHTGRYEYLDATAEPGAAYGYRLAVRGGGGTRWLGPVTVQLPARIAALAWRAAGPNPFARRAAVTLAIPRAAEGAVRVYDVQGKRVRTLAQGRFAAGERTLEWDGCDDLGARAAAGLYFVSAEVGGERARLRLARVP